MSPEGTHASLGEALAHAAAGDTIRVRGGVHPGPVEVDRPVRLVGEDWPTIDGGGQGTVIAVRSPRVSIEGFVVRNSGVSLDQENSGIAVDGAPGALVAGNRLEDVLFGVYLRESPDSAIRDNRIQSKDLDLPRRGDAIRVWYSDGTVIENNEVFGSRDVVLWYSKQLTVRGNRVRSGRYGLHFMYCDDARIEENLLFDNSVGAFLMYSRRLQLIRNSIAGSQGPSGYGVGLKDMDDALVKENLFLGNRVGTFLDNSPREMASVTEISANLFAGNDIGVFLLPNVRRARFNENSFIENQEQVSLGGRGGDLSANTWLENYWSDYTGFDADGDGVGDTTYRAERLFENLTDRQPELRLFRLSPAAQAVDFAARAFPVVQPRPKLADIRPRMAPHELQGLPTVPQLTSRLWTPLSVGMLAAAALVLSAPHARRRGGVGRRSAAAMARTNNREDIVIEAQGLTRTFGDKTALDDLCFSIRRGEAVALWGPNGAGKTTALRAILGIIPYDGQVWVRGLDTLRQGKALREEIGFVPQEIGFPTDLEVKEALELFARLRRAPFGRVEELLAWLALEDHLDKRLGQLSGGLKQRLALAVALVADPPLLVLDEPTANLDAAARTAFFQFLRELKRQGKTMVFTSHRVEELFFLADRVLSLEEGRLVAEGPPDALTLNGSSKVEIHLRVADEQLIKALEILDVGGYGPRRLGRYVVMTIESKRKIEPMELLLERGIVLEDVDLSPYLEATNGRS